MQLLRVIDNPDLARSKENSAILNTNSDALNKYKEEREQRLKLKEIAEDYDDLRSDVNEIKSMLEKILGHIDR